ncbi:MAG: hypothetical protein PHE79_08435 [Eubacteriales bacterium]|nr:hypothetical protein [Eubacteriales bacterium]
MSSQCLHERRGGVAPQETVGAASQALSDRVSEETLQSGAYLIIKVYKSAAAVCRYCSGTGRHWLPVSEQ